MHGKQYHNDTFSMNWDIHNLQLPYKLTTPQPLGGHQHHQPKAHQSNGHAFSLAPLSRKSKTVSHLLARRNH
eukprot:CCRYP_003953-RH/>CCRYP_003953-RH protein AED:0.46 eAED:0.46 QI:0/-1/0/1/-1/0/1/0/71